MREVPTHLLPEHPNLALSARQLSFHAALRRRSERLAMWYVAAIQTLDSDLPDRAALCAHAMRELMEKFPECAEIEISSTAQAANTVREIQEALGHVKKKSAAAEGWTGNIDAQLREFLASLEKKIDDYHRKAMNRSEEARQAYRDLVPAGSTMPKRYEDQHVKRWLELKRFFVQIAHHNAQAEDALVAEKIVEFEQLAGVLVAPEPTDEYDILDRLIREAEGGD